MKIKLGFKKYVEEEFELPEKFEFILTKHEDEYTEDEWSLYYEDDFSDWVAEVTGIDPDYDDYDIID